MTDPAFIDTGLLYLTVADGWGQMALVDQKELAIALREQWKIDCQCYAPILMFQSASGVDLMTIAAGQPKVIR